MDDLTGHTIRGYELHERIGAGGFGAVYRAHQPSVDREVAIKIILPQHTRREEFVQRFEAEARLIARLEHVHIVPLYDFWHEPGGNAYIVMRFLRGGSLRQLVKRGPLTSEQVRRMLGQVAAALALAHAEGIIHRDIKPDNILLDEQQNAYLSDFGIAKDLVGDRSLTTTSGTLGSPAYVAPEQFFGGQITPATDVYSLGMTLFECLAGSHPFPDNYVKHLQKPLPSLHGLRPDVPAALDLVLLRATDKDATARYDTVVALVDAVEAAYGAQAAQAPAADSIDGMVTVTGEAAAVVAMPSGPVTPPVTPQHPSESGEQSATLVTVDRDIPSGPARLVGRDALLDEVDALLDDGQQVLLHGLAGIGKTAVAAGVVHRRLEAGKGPVLWLRAGRQDVVILVEALIRPFRKSLAITPQNLQAPTVRQLLDDKAVKLVVIDDAWNDDALRDLANVLPPRLPLLVTSRQRYSLRRIVNVGELDPADSLALLGEHAGKTFTPADADAVELCRQMGDHPFALELAGRTLQVDELTPAELIQRLSGEPHRIAPLAGFGEAGGASVEQLFDASIEVLDGESRAVFLALGALFAPSGTPAMLATMLNRPVGSALTNLARRGIVRRVRLSEADGEIVVYQLHALTHSYARAATHISPATVIEAARHYLRRYAGSLDALDAERANLLGAAQAAAAADDDASLIRLAAGLAVETEYLAARGHDPLMREVLDQAIAATRREDHDRRKERHYLLGKRADIHFDLGELDRALTLYDESLALARELAITHREGVVLCAIGRAHANREDVDAAETALDEAAEIAIRTGDDLLEARVFEVKSYLYAVVKRDFEAVRLVSQQQVAVSERLGDPERLFWALINLGAAEEELAQLDAALPPLERALALAREHDNLAWIGLALSNLGLVHDRRGERDRARAVFDEALDMYRRSGLAARVAELTGYMRGAGYDVPE